jgi:hypothetical protein
MVASARLGGVALLNAPLDGGGADEEIRPDGGATG